MALLCAVNGLNITTEIDGAQLGAKKIVVIGAGLAGLTAAYRLHKKGFNVHVYEARNRVGGRILSALINDRVVELGGANIVDGGRAENMHRLIDEFGLQLMYYPYESFDYFFQHDNALSPADGLIQKHTINEKTLEDDLQGIAQSCNSMSEVLDRFFKSDNALKAYFSTRLAVYEGAPADQLSSCYIKTLYHMIRGGLSVAHQGKGMQSTYIMGGNSVLPYTIARELGDRIHLEMPLISIVKNEQENYNLTFKNGAVTTADVVILAIPCPVYKNIFFGDDVISADKLVAIRTIQNGSNTKILIPRTDDFSASTVLVNDKFGICAIKKDISLFYFTGQSSFFEAHTIGQTYQQAEALFVSRFKEDLLPKYAPIFARDEPFLNYSGSIGYSWPNDPFAQGAYSYIAPGQESLFELSRIDNGFTVKSLFAPIDDRIYFAGEHASTLLDVPGTMEAACQSGNLVADMIERSFE